METKLRANADHYTNEEMKMAYFATRVGGMASKHIAPRMQTGTANQFQNVGEMIALVKRIFTDPNQKQNARRGFRRLAQGANQDFHTFHTEFLRLAQEAEIPEETLKEELLDKLNLRLQEALALAEDRETTYDEFVGLCAKGDNRLRAVASRRVALHQKGKLPDKKPETGGKVPRAPSPTTARPIEGREKKMREGRCFECNETGHLARDCPDRKPKPAPVATAGTSELSEESDRSSEN
jgi:hypothetical protein